VVTELDLPVEEVETEDQVVSEVPNQGRFDGSWGPGTRTTRQWGQRILSTAYCCLSLEVYYRYLPLSVR